MDRETTSPLFTKPSSKSKGMGIGTSCACPPCRVSSTTMDIGVAVMPQEAFQVKPVLHSIPYYLVQRPFPHHQRKIIFLHLFVLPFIPSEGSFDAG